MNRLQGCLTTADWWRLFVDNFSNTTPAFQLGFSHKLAPVIVSRPLSSNHRANPPTHADLSNLGSGPRLFRLSVLECAYIGSSLHFQCNFELTTFSEQVTNRNKFILVSNGIGWFCWLVLIGY